MTQKVNKFTNKSSKPLKLSLRTLIIVYVCLILLVIGLMIIASFYDYQIDNALASWALPNQVIESITVDGNTDPLSLLGRVYTYSAFAIIVEVLGVLPLAIGMTFSMGVFYKNANRLQNKSWKITIKVVSTLIGIGIYCYVLITQVIPTAMINVMGVENFANKMANANWKIYLSIILPSIIFAGLLTFIQFYVFKFVNSNTIYQMIRWAWIYVLVTISTLVIVEIVKSTCVRERFRFIYAFNNVLNVDYNGISYTGKEFSNLIYGGFKHWYDLSGSIQPITSNIPHISHDICRSFPSGHTASASIGFMSMILAPFVIKNWNTKNIKICFFLFGVLGVITVGIGRMVAGAHYLSDVTVAATITMVFYIVYYWAFTYKCKWMDKWCNEKSIY